MLETELKLAVAGSFTPAVAAERAGLAGIDELPPLDLRATYYDTPDLRLARSGLTLRHRTGDVGGARWTLKLPQAASDGAGRDELEIEGAGHTVPDQAGDLVTAFVRNAALTPVARLRTRRRRWALRDREAREVAELVDDRVSVLQRGRVVERFRELEIEDRGVGREGLERIARALADDGAAPAPQVPKAVRALGPRAAAPPEVAAPEGLEPGAPAAAAVQVVIARSVSRIIANDPRTRLGEVEPLHQMRVGTRRLRSDLRTFAPLVDREWADALRVELEWLGRVLGEVRDLDVMLSRLHADARDLEGDLRPLFDALGERREAARETLLGVLRSARYVDLLDRLVEAARGPSVTPEARRARAESLGRLVRDPWGKLEKAASALAPGDADAEFHRVRVLAKRARYGAEAVAPSLRAKRARRARKFARRAAALQDRLGELQDAVVARDTILEIAGAHPEDVRFNFAAGRLVEREMQRRAACRDGFEREWARLRGTKPARWTR